jgi:hypothetical protein
MMGDGGNVQQSQRILALAALLALAACQSSPTKSPLPTPSAPATIPAPPSVPQPPAKPEPPQPVSTTSQSTPPSSGSPSKGDPAASKEGSPQTSEERRVAVAQRIDESLGTFDATLRKEQGDLAKEREQRASDTAKSGADAKGGDGVEDVNADAGIDPEKAKAREARRGGMKSEAEGAKTGEGDKTGSGDNGAAEQGNVGEGHVDDIVGRQICEAAQKETDPELKDKLMKECQQYRNGSK